MYMELIDPNQVNIRKATRTIYIYLFMVLSYSSSFAQFNEEMPRAGSRTISPIIYEAIPYWTDDTTSIELAVLYRISPAFLFFAKRDNTQQEIYEAKGELVIEILDDKDATIVRDFRPLRIERNSLPAEDAPPSNEIQGIFQFKLPLGLYRIIIEVKDNESGKSFIDREGKVTAQIFSSSRLNISPAILVEPIPSDTSANEQRKFFPINRGGNIIIGQTGGCLFQVISIDTSANLSLSWKVQRKNETDEDIPQELNGNRCIQQSGTPFITENPKSIFYTIKKDSKHSRLIFVPITFERLETGKYQLTLTMVQDTLKSMKEFAFSVIWPLKPRSLSDFKLAVDALRYIATEEEINQMTVFSSSKARKAFREFWQKQNPDTIRAFNPTMAEYYRRVDETIRRFSSTNEMDGYHTDRGRIYILFGSPSIINRLLKPNTAPTEIWTYEKLKRRFTFTDQQKTGNYILVKTEEY